MSFYQSLNESLRGYQSEMDQLAGQSQALSELSGDSHASVYSAQLIGRYQQLAQLMKDAEKKAEEHVHEHEQYEMKLLDINQWLMGAKARYSSCLAIPAGQHDALNTKQAILQVYICCQIMALLVFLFLAMTNNLIDSYKG